MHAKLVPSFWVAALALSFAACGGDDAADGSAAAGARIAPAPPPGVEAIDDARLVAAASEPQSWLTYSGNFKSQRYSLLNQVTPENVKNLELQWVYQARSLEKYEATPLVVDGVMYTIQNPDDVIALDPVTGRVFWKYSWTPSTESRPCCGRLSRGVGIVEIGRASCRERVLIQV